MLLPDTNKPRGEEGIAMIVVVTIMSILVVLAITITSIGVHSDESTARDRGWNAAVAVAEAGVETAFRDHGRNVFQSGTSQSFGLTTTAAGQFEGEVSRCTAVNAPSGCPGSGYVRVQSTGYTPRKNANRGVKRTLQAFYGPERSFRFALFSLDHLEIGNQPNATACSKPKPDIEGDVYAKESITVGNNVQIRGSLITHRGPIVLGNSNCMQKDALGLGGSVYSGGSQTSGSTRSGIFVGSSSVLQGDAEVRADCSTSLPGGHYNLTIENGAAVLGTGVTPPSGNLNGSGPAPVGGWKKQCKQQYKALGLPPLPSVTTAMEQFADIHCKTMPTTCTFTHASPAAFQSWAAINPGLVKGYHYVNAPGEVDMTSTTINGDFVLRTIGTVRVGSASNKFYQGPGTNNTTNVGKEVSVQVIAENTTACSGSTGSLVLDNGLNFTITSSPTTDLPSTLFYSMGCVRVNNKVVVPGAVYGSSISGANNLSIVYNPDVEATVGVGSNRLSLSKVLEVSV